MPRKKFNELFRHLQDIMMESLPNMVDERINKILQTQVSLHVAQVIILEIGKSQAKVDSSVRSYMLGHVLHVYPTQPIPTNAQQQRQDDHHDDAYFEGKNSEKRQKTSEHETFLFGESSSGHDYESEPDDDVLPNEKVSQELLDEMSQTVDEAKLRKIFNEMLRQQCTLGDEHQYHID
nr:hypothetical protein [Tanacetum cinerariifolium]